MFEQGLFSDLILAFEHPTFPITFRFDVHKAIVSQSPFFTRLLSKHDPNDEPNPSRRVSADGRTILTINLLTELTQNGFVLTPFQHIIRRKWQKSTKAGLNPRALFSHLFARHLRCALRWMYAIDKADIVRDELEEQDDMRLLVIAVLFGLDDLAQICVNRYIREKLSLETIQRDLEHICQLPHKNKAYLTLHDAALLLLLRHGPAAPQCIADLPVDYMADVLSADMLWVENEFERYSLLRRVLTLFMHSLGTITWTRDGPRDQDEKRLSGFVKQPVIKKSMELMDPETVRLGKRKRIPSEELETASGPLTRLSFSATVPFTTLQADAGSGGVIDKATILSYLLKTTIIYSNMTFDQLSRVRHDGIVDETVVFRALWQRKAIERILYPENTFFDSQSDALDHYFDVDASESQERRRQLLLGIPRYRFSTCIELPVPRVENGWTCIETKQESDEHETQALQVSEPETHDENVKESHTTDVAQESHPDSTSPQERSKHHVWRTVVYSSPKSILNVKYRVRVDAEVVPDKLVKLADEDEDDMENTGDAHALLCKFYLEHVPSDSPVSPPAEPVAPTPEPRPLNEETLQEPMHVQYTLYCLSRHEPLINDMGVDPEDRAMVPVTKVTGGKATQDYVRQVYLGDVDHFLKAMQVEVVVVMEAQSFQLHV